MRLRSFLLAAALIIAGSLPAFAQVPTACFALDVPDTNSDTGAILSLSPSVAASAQQTNCRARGLVCVINITAISGTSPTLTVAIQGYDAASGSYFTLLSSAALSATGTTVLTVYPGTTAAANTDANAPLPMRWRLNPTLGGTVSTLTGTVGCNEIR